ncbi:transcriptional regulator GlxA family with amidase domain [Streptosporangium becharense]|uniref:Transcriptional regulator GlxA family with amidase domain n=1 Tax=Streptosporangium becharense TaxID=1816182 RepID=A0A7W9MHQ2_9ACTN|nr:helix-turn-helix domain-containing protein [Streptosporangium becharense]MBB2912476.1 transcriptional regulator GlxA family with amidase domain [Streptosporangium becharense]MBB5820694.1 transcriptional regulator GlxA family with amidase domain [Streptosporangium becharense]
MHTVAVLALDNVIPFDLATPLEVFGRTRLPGERPGYRVRVCAPTPQVEAGLFTVQARLGLEALADADTVIVAGTTTPLEPVPDPVLDALRVAGAAGTRVASICTGAFVLAQAGLLDGLRATTHWFAAPDLARMYPRVEVDADVLYVDNGRILTSAGAAAGLDLCLHMIRRDYGSVVAADAARLAVVPLEREGGQAQFIVHRQPPVPRGSTLEPLLHWLEDNADRDLTLDEIARHARMSPRTLLRRFREQTGTTPLQWLHRVRIRQAQHLLETTGHSVERIAAQVGFGSPTAFRDRFKRITGVTPRSYRHAFQ